MLKHVSISLPTKTYGFKNPSKMASLIDRRLVEQNLKNQGTSETSFI